MAKPVSSLRAVSLLPYLQASHCAPRTSLSLIRGSSDASFPFAVIDDSAPFSRIIRGAFVTDAGSRLADLFLVVQKDRYLHMETPFTRVSNLDIEACWQEAFERSSRGNVASMVSLAGQLDAGGELGWFEPLLYCREKDCFLPMLCPSCGSVLVLCSDDELLGNSGLHPYSSSSVRYMYCKPCSSSGGSEFYVRERADSDPQSLSDCRDLIDRLRNLVAREDILKGLPCCSCPELGNCFGPTNSARNRLIPFSFYPFHLLLFSAPDLNALDFISLVSGATWDELARQIDQRSCPGRYSTLLELADAGPARWTTFQKGDARGFAELLFLKLALLEEVAGRIAYEGLTPPEAERVWVHFSKIGRNLPAGWNYRLVFTDDLTPAVSRHTLDHNPSMVLAKTALFLFQVLLGNRDIPAGVITEAVSRYLSGSSEGGRDSAADSDLKSLCAPANIFRNAAGMGIIGREHLDCWDRVCAAGFELLDAALGSGISGCRELHQTLQALMETARDALFTGAQSVPEPCLPPVDGEISARIGRVIAGMIQRCRTEQRGIQPPAHDDRSDEVIETVILRAGAPPEPLTAISDKDAETVIISSPPPVSPAASVIPVAPVAPVAPFPEKRVVTPQPEDELQETVMISSSPQVQEKGYDAPQHPEDELHETVIISSGYAAQPAQFGQTPVPEPAKQQPPAAKAPVEEELEETVMLVPPPGRNRPGGNR